MSVSFCNSFSLPSDHYSLFLKKVVKVQSTFADNMSYPSTPKQCRRKLRKKPTTNTLSTDYSYCSLFYIRKILGSLYKPSKGRRLSSSSEKSGDFHGRPLFPGGMAPPHFGRSVNPISIEGGRLFPPNNTGTPGFSDFPTALHGHGEQPKPEPTREKTYYTSSEGDSDEDNYEDANNNNSY